MPLPHGNAQTLKEILLGCCGLNFYEIWPIFFFILIVCHQIMALKKEKLTSNTWSTIVTDLDICEEKNRSSENDSKIAYPIHITGIHWHVNELNMWRRAVKTLGILDNSKFTNMNCCNNKLQSISTCCFFLIFWSSTKDWASGGSTFGNCSEAKTLRALQVFPLRKLVCWGWPESLA